jgi:predicted nucleotidyltransferase
MHTSKSDIDLAVYGGGNFRRVEKTIHELVKSEMLSYVFSNRLDAIRRHKGRYLKRIFMYNAVRKSENSSSTYGLNRYLPLKNVVFSCVIEDDREAIFRPAIYKVKQCKSETRMDAFKGEFPSIVAAMIGCYRNIARRGDTIQVSGMLEKVSNIKTGDTFRQVVVGSASQEEEYIWPHL